MECVSSCVKHSFLPQQSHFNSLASGLFTFFFPLICLLCRPSSLYCRLILYYFVIKTFACYGRESLHIPHWKESRVLPSSFVHLSVAGDGPLFPLASRWFLVPGKGMRVRCILLFSPFSWQETKPNQSGFKNKETCALAEQEPQVRGESRLREC